MDFDEVSSKLQWLLIIELTFSSLHVVRGLTEIFKPCRMNFKKGKGKVVMDVFKFFHFFRYISLCLITRQMMSFSTSVCMCQVRAYFYNNCYILAGKRLHADYTAFECYPKFKKNDWVMKYVYDKGGYNFSRNSYICMSDEDIESIHNEFVGDGS